MIFNFSLMPKDPLSDSCLSCFLSLGCIPPAKAILENSEVEQKEVLPQQFFLRHSDLI